MIAGATRHSEKLGLRRIRATLGRGEALGDYGNWPSEKSPVREEPSYRIDSHAAPFHLPQRKKRSH